jgi:hypothetical protein
MSTQSVCFWCEGPIRDEKPLVIEERTVEDNSGAHIEETLFHSDCALLASAILTEALCEKTRCAPREDL